MNVDENTGDLAICPNYDITGLTIVPDSLLHCLRWHFTLFRIISIPP